MVGAGDMRVYIGSAQLRCNPGRYKKIVYTPAHILLAGSASIAPPAISTGCIGMQVPERIDKSGVEQLGETSPFLVGKSRILAVALRIGEIDFCMGYIHVSTYYYRLLGIELFHKVHELAFPVHAVVEACQFALRIWSIYIYEVELLIFQHHYPTLMVMPVHSYMMRFRQRLDPAEGSGTRIPLAIGITIIRCVSAEGNVGLTLLKLYLLQRKNIGVQRLKYLLETLTQNSPKAVYVP